MADPVIDRSGVIVAGGTSQQACGPMPTRRYLFILNPKVETESLWFNFGVVAITASPSIELAPGDTFCQESNFCSGQFISVKAATTNHTFVIKEG